MQKLTGWEAVAWMKEDERRVVEDRQGLQYRVQNGDLQCRAPNCDWELTRHIYDLRCSIWSTEPIFEPVEPEERKENQLATTTIALREFFLSQPNTNTHNKERLEYLLKNFAQAILAEARKPPDADAVEKAIGTTITALTSYCEMVAEAVQRGHRGCWVRAVETDFRNTLRDLMRVAR
jgi:hypothetical protein